MPASAALVVLLPPPLLLLTSNAAEASSIESEDEVMDWVSSTLASVAKNEFRLLRDGGGCLECGTVRYGLVLGIR